MNRTLFLALSLTFAMTAQPVLAEEPAATPASEPAAAPSGEMATPGGEPAATPKSEAAPQKGTIAKIAVTTGIKDHEPVDEVENVGADTSTIYLFTDLRGMKGEHITHRWMYNGQVVADVGFDVKGNRWRVWSSKTLQPMFAGKWTVKVLDSAGNELASKEFEYSAK
jgi:3D (Asp-Asp-Asp) domain-containing protein